MLVWFLVIKRFSKNNTGLSDHTAQWISVARGPRLPHSIYVY